MLTDELSRVDWDVPHKARTADRNGFSVFSGMCNVRNNALDADKFGVVSRVDVEVREIGLGHG